jgi:hypothetical protein
MRGVESACFLTDPAGNVALSLRVWPWWSSSRSLSANSPTSVVCVLTAGELARPWRMKKSPSVTVVMSRVVGEVEEHRHVEAEHREPEVQGLFAAGAALDVAHQRHALLDRFVGRHR